jgi:hypothetical protein
MLIILNTLNGTKYNLSADPSETIDDLKKKVYEKTGLAVSAQVLIFAGTTLVNGARIQNYPIKHCSPVWLISTLVGG